DPRRSSTIVISTHAAQIAAMMAARRGQRRRGATARSIALPEIGALLEALVRSMLDRAHRNPGATPEPKEFSHLRRSKNERDARIRTPVLEYEQSEAETSVPGNERILIVEDDRDILVAAKLLLRRHFGEVVTATDPDRIPEMLAQTPF